MHWLNYFFLFIIKQYRVSDLYLKGIAQFLDFAFVTATEGGKILCPCINCNNCLLKSQEDVYDDLICDGFLKGYTNWVYHGEGNPSIILDRDSNAYDDQDDMHGMLQDAFGIATLEGELANYLMNIMRSLMQELKNSIS